MAGRSGSSGQQYDRGYATITDGQLQGLMQPQEPWDDQGPPYGPCPLVWPSPKDSPWLWGVIGEEEWYGVCGRCGGRTTNSFSGHGLL